MNDAAARLWERSPQRFGVPSRWTALPDDRTARAHALAGEGVIRGYSGVRVSATGRRFVIEDATIWLVLRDAHVVGQAATFASWRPVPRILIEVLCTSMAEVTAGSPPEPTASNCASHRRSGGHPPTDLIREAVLRAEAGVGVMVSDPSSGGDFVYSAGEADQMRASIADATSAGAGSGARLPGMRRAGGHRIDCGVGGPGRWSGDVPPSHRRDPDCVVAARQVADLGCDRILSSGGAHGTRRDSSPAAMTAAVPVTVMAGSGLTPGNVRDPRRSDRCERGARIVPLDGRSLVAGVRAALTSPAVE